MREKIRGARWVKMACKTCAKRTANAAAAAAVLFAQIFCEWVSHKKGTVSVVCSLRSPKKRVKNKKKEPFQLCVRSPGTEPASGQMSAGFAPRRPPRPPAVSSHTRLIFRRHLLVLCSVALRLLLLSYLSISKCRRHGHSIARAANRCSHYGKLDPRCVLGIVLKHVRTEEV